MAFRTNPENTSGALIYEKVPFLSNDDIENHTAERLAAARMIPTPENPILDLEAFIQGSLGAVLDEYADLPPGVMGEVVFEPGCKDHVKINRNLSEQADEGAITSFQIRTTHARRRSTTAHEAGHIILHRDLLMPSVGQGSLFETSDSAPSAYAHRCLESDFGVLKFLPDRRPIMHTDGEIISREVDYLEIQANKCMAALLLPRSVFCDFALERMRLWEMRRGHISDHAHRAERRQLIQDFAGHFLVSRQVIEIRIKTLKLESQSQNTSLF